ncbi:unnamed protein product [Psylliodes chrysocephalus]|uniref:Uncharacterized protein n=1 Tax=Psylliodes chrysocephalus TaxID=3402493 RepID=A0A9P0G5K1_9CUCU|nr:unnamed protein product [Psylliodes chrysocephala]
MRLKTHNSTPGAKKGKEAGLKKWLSEDKNKEYSKKDCFNIYTKVIHTELSHKLHFIEFEIVDKNIREQISQIIHKKIIRQQEKLKSLTFKKSIIPKQKSEQNTNKISDHTFFKRFVNLTTTNFSDPEQYLIEKGFKHNIAPKINTSNLEILGIETEIALKDSYNTLSHKYHTANIIETQFLRNNNSNQDNEVQRFGNLDPSTVIYIDGYKTEK